MKHFLRNYEACRTGIWGQCPPASIIDSLIFALKLEWSRE